MSFGERLVRNMCRHLTIRIRLYSVPVALFFFAIVLFIIYLFINMHKVITSNA